METSCRCHSCDTEVDANTRRCPHCYVALEAASRAPAPLRATPAPSADGRPSATVVSGAATIIDDPGLPFGARCPSCEATMTPYTGWCSYCMDPLPVAGAADLGAWGPDEWDLSGWDLGPDEDDEAPGGRVIAGPWPDRRVGPTYATWRQRAAAAAIDAAAFVPAAIAGCLVAAGVTAAIALALLLAAVAFSGWQVWHQGRSGQTIGKSVVGIFLVGESDLAPIGARRAGLRQLAHAMDAVLFGIGYLWPLWDAKHQTFADQLFATVVVAG